MANWFAKCYGCGRRFDPADIIHDERGSMRSPCCDGRFARMGNAKIEVGDILSSSWGYDQTNIDYYLVTKRTPRMATLQKIGAKQVGVSGHYNQLVPDPEKILENEEPLRRKIHTAKEGREETGCSIESYSWASPVRPGSVQSETDILFGH